MTRTDMGACVDVLEESLGRKLLPGEVVHTFNDKGTLTIRDIEVQRIEASRIEDDETAVIVFFKMNLSTGWDCPRAETMMSFRSAQDFTYIAQLLGRMIRTPLARRITSNADLNNVSLFLPYYDEDTVANVVNALRESEDILPTETGSSRELVSLSRNPEFSDIFANMDSLVTYSIDAARKQAALRLYIQLSRALTMDGIDLDAWSTAKKSVLKQITDEIDRMKASGGFEKKASALTGFSVGTVTFEYGDGAFTYDDATQTMKMSEFDINRHFDKSGKLLGEGLHTEYWIRNNTRNHIDVKLEIIIFTGDTSALERLSAFASEQFESLYEKYKCEIAHLPEARASVYERMTSASARPIAVPWVLPERIDFSISDYSAIFENHLYVSEDASFKTVLNPWESGVVKEELANGAVAWLRNLDRKKWSLEIPYEVNGEATAMYPDLVIVRADTHGYIFDILEPHDDSRKDNYPKAVGLAKFAEKHWKEYGRIQLIRKSRGVDGQDHFYRLDMSKMAIRNKVRAITSNSELDRIFDDDAERED